MSYNSFQATLPPAYRGSNEIYGLKGKNGKGKGKGGKHGKGIT